MVNQFHGYYHSMKNGKNGLLDGYGNFITREIISTRRSESVHFAKGFFDSAHC